MAKVRFLQSAVLLGTPSTVFNFNDEVEVNDTLAKELAEQGVVDILVEEPEKPVKATRGKATKQKPVEEKPEEAEEE